MNGIIFSKRNPLTNTLPTPHFSPEIAHQIPPQINLKNYAGQIHSLEGTHSDGNAASTIDRLSQQSIHYCRWVCSALHDVMNHLRFFQLDRIYLLFHSFFAATPTCMKAAREGLRQAGVISYKVTTLKGFFFAAWGTIFPGRHGRLQKVLAVLDRGRKTSGTSVYTRIKFCVGRI